MKIMLAGPDEWSYIKENLENYWLDDTDAKWEDFCVAKEGERTVAFCRIVEREGYLEIASLGVDYYRREKGIGSKLFRYMLDLIKERDPGREVYVVTDKPDFFRKFGLKETLDVPDELEDKRQNKCRSDASKIKILKAKI